MKSTVFLIYFVRACSYNYEVLEINGEQMRQTLFETIYEGLYVSVTGTSLASTTKIKQQPVPLR